MGQHRQSYTLHIVGQAVATPIQQGAALGSPHQGQRAAGAGAQFQRRMAAGTIHQRYQVLHDLLAYENIAGLGLQRQNILIADHGGEMLPGIVVRIAGQDIHLFPGRGVAHGDAHEEAVHLRLGQRIGADVFHRVLGSQHHKGGGQRIGNAVHRYLMLLHGLQQG